MIQPCLPLSRAGAAIVKAVTHLLITDASIALDDSGNPLLIRGERKLSHVLRVLQLSSAVLVENI